jgi:hypothetical protein
LEARRIIAAEVDLLFKKLNISAVEGAPISAYPLSRKPYPHRLPSFLSLINPDFGSYLPAKYRIKFIPWNNLGQLPSGPTCPGSSGLYFAFVLHSDFFVLRSQGENMTARTPAHGLQVATELYRFIEDKVLPGTGVASDVSGRASTPSSDLAPKNIALLAERDRLQTELDTWHKANPGPIPTCRPTAPSWKRSATWCRSPRAPRPRPTSTPNSRCRPARSWWCPS